MFCRVERSAKPSHLLEANGTIHCCQLHEPLLERALEREHRPALKVREELPEDSLPVREALPLVHELQE